MEIIRSAADLLSLKSQWNTLLQASDSDCIFLGWEWISAWSETICPNPELYVIVVRDGHDDLTGIAPFYRHQLSLFGFGSFRCLSVLGSGRLSGAEYPDIIIRKGAESEVLGAIAHLLRENREDWDCIWIPNLADWRSAADRLDKVATIGRFWIRRRAQGFSAITLPADYKAYEQTLSRNARHHLRRCTRRIMNDHGGELVICDNHERLEQMLGDHMRLSRSRWASVGERGTFRFPQREAFYRSISTAALNAGCLGFYGLRIDGVMRAYWFGFVWDDIYYSMSLSWDIEYEQQHHTGAANVLFGQFLPLLMQRHVREFDHLGGISNYKTRWGAVARAGSQVLISAGTLKGMLLHFSSAWPNGRYLKLDTSAELADQNQLGVTDDVGHTEEGGAVVKAR